MEDFVRCLIHEKRENTERRSKPSKAFARLFGERYGVELPATAALRLQAVVALQRGPRVTAPLAWLIDTKVTSE